MAKPSKKQAVKAEASGSVEAPVKLTVVADEGEALTPVLRKKEFIERVVVQSGAKRGEVKKISEAVLKVLGDALSAGEGLHLAPLGRARIARSADKSGAEVLVIKLKRSTEADEKTSKEGVAEAED